MVRLALAALALVLAVPAAVAPHSESVAAPIRIVATVTARLDFTAPPPSKGPVPPVTAVSFLDANHGLLAIGGFGGTGGIGETADGGRSWTTVWRHKNS